MIAFDADGLSCDGRHIPTGEVLGFEERYDSWSGRAFLRVRGAAHEEPIAAGYGELRQRLREAFPDRPFDADWSDGHFPAMPLGLPEPWLRLGGGAVAVLVALGASQVAPLASVPVGVVAGWAALGSWGRVRLSPMGVHVGAGWAPRRGWHEVDAIHVEVRGRWARVVVRVRGRVLEGTVPSVLVPALRAKVWRHGGLQLEGAMDELDLTYSRWAPRLVGLTGAVAVVGSALAFATEAPWSAWSGALAATLGFALLAGAAEARAGGWATGAVLALTALYGLLLGVVGLL